MTQTDTSVELTRDDIVREVEVGARARLGMSAQELARSYRGRTLQNPSAVVDLLVLLDLLDDEDSIFGGPIVRSGAR